MLQDRSAVAACARLVLVVAMTSSLGCFAHSRGEMDWDENPVANTGAGATIIYPGQTAPTYAPRASRQPSSGTAAAPPNQAPPGGSAGAPATGGSAPSYSSGPNGGQSSGSPQPTGIPITMIGGAEQDIDGHLSWKQEPVWWKYLALPFAAIAAPFKAAADAVRGEPEEGPEIPESRPPGLEAGGPASSPPPVPRNDQPAAPPAPPQRQTSAPEPSLDYESSMVNQLERELAQRESRSTPQESGTSAYSTRPDHPESTGQPLSIAAELAALQRSSGADTAAAPVARAPDHFAVPAAPPTRPAADGVVDRDGDGRVDQWIYRREGEITRIELDESGDGRVDRILHYDLESHEIARVEEDSDGDGVSDSWTDYEDGHVARRRGDGDHDGNVDTWSFYREGVITRHERDSDGDGFRDRTGFYVDGKLIREEYDRDGDGRPDTAILYDDHERVSRREEDNDNDGIPDVISHYEAGKLSRRELLEHPGGTQPARP